MPYKDKLLNKRASIISHWKTNGMNILDKEHGWEIYNLYKNTTHCDLCNIELGERRDLDHDHKTGEIRNVVCHKCNMWRIDNKNVKYITKRFRKDRNKDYYYVQITRNNKKVLTTKTTDYNKAVLKVKNYMAENPNYFL